MRPEPPPAPLHLPFEPGPYRLAMALQACAEADWIEIDAGYRAELALRRGLLDLRRPEVLGLGPDTLPARRELLALLAHHMPARFPAWFAAAPDGRLRNRLTGEVWQLDHPAPDPLDLAARLVQEDLCLLRLDAGTPVLTDAALCFPSRWRLAEKLGRPLASVHEPVPLYAERLAAPVDRFMAALRPGRIAKRYNWALVDDPALFQPAGKFRAAHDPAITATNAGARLWLRVERQTLRLLPASGAVVFTIRVHVTPLARIAIPAVAASLAEAVRALPEATLRYKSIAPFRAAVLGWLDRRSDAVSPLPECPR